MQAVVDDAPPLLVPSILRVLYAEPVTARALRWGDVNAVVDALRWRRWAGRPPPDVLAARKAATAEQLHEPIAIPVAMRDELGDFPEEILTSEGRLRFEEEYLPRVCTAEHGSAHPEAKAALVVAARTFVLRAMRDHPLLGRTTPISNSTRFQTFARTAGAECIAAAERTRGIAMRYGGRLIVANYVAGALWRDDGSVGKDPTETERWVTYNAGKNGADVKPTRLTLSTHPGNRGCMSQNGSDWLARHGWGYQGILRFFYGKDVDIGARNGSGNSGVLFGLVGLVMLGLAHDG
ncbi:SpoIID/LytB domain-containing protein [Polyangium sp. 6x1]|uniref:SpoIID/LytB domain-containing protein n=1 Tax=Polyangium sp. 6x1 TaxID=3042689 RepID=UPI0024828124|nr:SpoIID/LytB domain-containing protein [Polyangium sp. 6x1]MDI1445944.1 SpoIID/LytB domain-containing protein [Polyangium sp. 6x1]